MSARQMRMTPRRTRQPKSCCHENQEVYAASSTEIMSGRCCLHDRKSVADCGLAKSRIDDEESSINVVQCAWLCASFQERSTTMVDGVDAASCMVHHIVE
jgi:hypothetical protein